MTLDRVHDLQNVFRKMIRVHSFPGRILSLTSILGGIDDDLPLPPHLCVIALTLLDAETGFAVSSARSDEQARLISQLTYAHPVSLPEADFIFARSGDEYLHPALEAAKEGTLENPHEGATVILEVSGMASDDPANFLKQSGTSAESPATDGIEDKRNLPAGAANLVDIESAGWSEWILTGPGIEIERRFRVAGNPRWAEIRAERNKEFPLGVDLLLIDPTGLIAALPRTTKMRPVVEGGA